MNKKDETQNIIDYDELEKEVTQIIDRIISENHELRFETGIDICPSIKLEKKIKNTNKIKSSNDLCLECNWELSITDISSGLISSIIFFFKSFKKSFISLPKY